MYAETVAAPVDRRIARLVDAVNRCSLRVETTNCCSSHPTSTGYAYLAFRAYDWDFPRLALGCVTELNRVTGGQTRLGLTEVDADGRVSGTVWLGIYPWLWAGEVDWAPLIAGLVFPPRRLVRLWWAELDTLAQMVEQESSIVPEMAIAQFQAERADRRRRGIPRWRHRAEELIAREIARA